MAGWSKLVACACAREGCENLVTAQENSAQVDAHGQLRQLCAADPQGTHVACDLLQTRNWDSIVALQALQQGLQEATGEAPSSSRHGNRKRR